MFHVFSAECNLLTPTSVKTEMTLDGLAGVYRKYRSSHLVSPDDRPDENNFRFLLWKAMQKFPEICEPKSKIITPLFFNFLE